MIVTEEKFEVDSAIIADLIHSQSGTIATALRELVMNALDAGSQSVKIRLGENKFEVVDSGKGFPNKEYISNFFKKFGTPHEEGDALYGRFRIGRGQIMSFGKVTWHSNIYKMSTDVNAEGYGYKLIEDESDKISGCTVSGEFYKPLGEYEIKHVREDLEELLKYANQEISFNGVVISKGTNFAWDYEDDEILARWEPPKRVGINLYSLGVFVKTIDKRGFGMNADIVTKKALKLNMARNEVSDSDPLWEKVFSLLTEESIRRNKELAKKARLTEEARISLIYNFMDGHIDLAEVRDLPLFKDCRGKKGKFDWFIGRLPVTISPGDGSRLSEQVATSNIARVLHHDDLRYWGVDSLEELLSEYHQLIVNYIVDKEGQEGSCRSEVYWAYRMLESLKKVKVVPFDQVSDGISADMTVLKTSELKHRDRAARVALRYANGILAGRINKIRETRKRNIEVGHSYVAEGWTDGDTYIVVNKRMLDLLDRGLSGAVQIINLLIHEYCHSQSDIGSHNHDFEFYELYHQLTTVSTGEEMVGNSSKSLLDRYHQELIKVGEALPKSAESAFDYPVINGLYSITGVLSGPLSELSLVMLRAVDHKLTKTKLSINMHYEKSYKLGGVIFDVIEKQMNADGFTYNDVDYYTTSIDDWHKAHALWKEQAMKKHLEWAEAKGHDVDVIVKIFENWRDRNPLKYMLYLICLDKHSSLRIASFDRVSKKRMFVTAGLNGTDDLSGYFARERKLKAYLASRDDMADSKEARFAFVVNKIRGIAKGFNDEGEMKEFSDRYFTKDMADIG